ncbi:unknown [Ruminococcus sp. CAG:353]|nr:unknown [Ruminococcus sp. CAG:353]
MQGAVIVTPRLYMRRMGNEDIAPLILIFNRSIDKADR